MLKRPLPQTMLTTSNPIFDFDTRKMQWFRGRTTLRWYGMRLLLLANVLMILPALTLSSGRQEYSFTRQIWFDIIIFAPPLIAIVIDVFYILSSINIVNGSFSSDNWEALVLTNLDDQAIIAARYALTQICGWRVMIADRVLQTAPTSFMVLWIFTNNAPGTSALILEFIGLIPFAWFASLWRMQALTALGLAISSRVRNTTFAILTGLGGALIFEILWFGLVKMVQVVVDQWLRDMPFVASTLEPTFFLPLMAVGTWLFFWLVKSLSLGCASNAATSRRLTNSAPTTSPLQ